MKIRERHESALDITMVKPDLRMLDGWDTGALASMIRSKSARGETPAFLFLGKKEAAMLLLHLQAAFGVDSVPSLQGTYYMGLEVVVVDCDTFVYAGGKKSARPLHKSTSRQPVWHDRRSGGIWQFRI